MALSKEEKDALNDHYKDRDLYDPSKAKEQEVASFSPKGMCEGGDMGYADGGEVGFDGPVLSSDTDTVKGIPPMPLPIAPPSPPLPPAAAMVRAPLLPMSRSMPPAPAPELPASARKLGPDEYSELVKVLGSKPSFGQNVASGFAGLADAIETGVARAGNPGFQKNISETEQNQKRNMIDALRGKYESEYKGEELGQRGTEIKEAGRHNKAAENIGEHEAEARLQEAKSALQQNALEAMGRLSQNGGMLTRLPGVGQPTEAQEAINALADRAGLAGVRTINTRAEYDALPKGTKYKDASGKHGIKK